jgi:protein O-mannosyl-transferase
MVQQKKDRKKGIAVESIESPRRAHLFLLAKGAFIAVLVTIAYWPAMNGDFILDDVRLISQNDLVKDQNGLYQIWFTANAIDYWPVTNTVFWLQWHLFGENPGGYHVTNLALHIAGCWLIWLVLERLAVPGAFLAAVLFAVHPVNVESVAWLSQLKNVLAMFFFLLSIVWYLKAQSGSENRTETERRKQRQIGSTSHFGRWYGLSLVAFTLAMLSKGSVAMLPLILLLLAYWKRGSLAKSDILQTLPFFAVAAVLSCVNVWFQTHGMDIVVRNATFLQRFLGAGAAVWFYLYKALWPSQLVFVYPNWNVQPSDFLWWLPLVAGLLVTAVLIWQRRRPWCRALFIAWIFFCVSLAPALGFVDVGYMKFSLVADHYQYFALIGVVAVVAAGWAKFSQRSGFAGQAANVLAIAVVGLLAMLTWQQCQLYANPIALYQATLEQNPDSWNIQNNLAAELNRAERWSEGMTHSLAALRLNPDLSAAHYNLGDELVKLNRPEEAIPNYRLALQEQPDYGEAQLNLGVALLYVGRQDEALQELKKAVPLKPDSFELFNNLATILLQRGSTDEAIQNFQQALKLKPDSAEVLANLAEAYARIDRNEDARASAQKALRLAQSQGKTELARAIANWLKDFNSKHPNSEKLPLLDR